MNQKVVVIGNGPSLRDHLDCGHFEMLANSDVTTVACNAIDFLYDKTDWRPDYYFHTETPLQHRGMDRIIDKHLLPKKEVCILGEHFHYELKERVQVRELVVKQTGKKDPVQGVKFEGMTDKLIYVRRCGSYYSDCMGHYTNGAWKHFPHFCMFGGVMNNMLPYVFMMGGTDVSVIGCDLGFDKKDTHFDTHYFFYSDHSAEEWNRVLETVHRDAREHFEKYNRSIVYCGIGGNLDAYKREDLETWLLK